MRGHDFGDFPAVPHDGGHQAVSVFGFGEEYVDGTPTQFGIRVEAPGVGLTVEQALEVANSLTVLAERIQFIQHQIERAAKSAEVTAI
ncbi:MAG: hypothetical protein ACR2JK_19145 [Geodermatophilaceae bacterium]